jgi:N-acetylglucosaminyldiphosphoundecaprenol N-acetyl-beta-D-mannosaminyltransferase
MQITHPAQARMTQGTKVKLGELACSPYSIPELLNEIARLVCDKNLQPRTILCVNAHIYNLAMQSPRLLQALNEAAITTADGMAIVWAARFLGQHIESRCNMTEAFRAFLENSRMPKTTAVLVGMSEPEAAAAAQTIMSLQGHCKIIGTASGFLDDEAYKNFFLQNADVNFILLGMSTPRTEFTAQLASSVCPRAVVWGIGAGTIRIYAGTMREAPAFFRRTGLQWLHRLWSEPRTLWKRYLLGNPRFAGYILKARFRVKARQQ